MPDMFPGMNPYFEHPDVWPEIHPQLISALARLLQEDVSERYNVLVRKRVYRVSGEDSLVVGQLTHELPEHGSETNGSSHSSSQPIPTYIAVPQTIKEDYIEIVDCQIGRTVTIIEVLTPQKKRPGRGRESYEQRCEAIFGSDTHFVEIDLLRGWEPISAYAPGNDVDYRVLVSRSDQRPKADLYAWQVNAPIPPLMLPLNCSQEEADAQAYCTVDLKRALDDVCIESVCRSLIDYERAPIPPLPPDANQWLTTLLEQSGLRQSSQSTNLYDEEKLKKRSAPLQA